MFETIERLRELDDAWMWEQGFEFMEPLELHMLSPNGITREVIAKFESERELELAISARNALPFLLDIAEAAQRILDAPSFEAFLVAGVDEAPLKAAANALARLRELEERDG